ncbi:hypothetical protein ElyMa_004568700 [Elysia marginata]|uniref:Uncharacterized protein n=1 Tax=Elysia marginata TaxID=1093978 RepID=A0AAV4HSV3_9GAST|nr:hypothetical protein ElyMa_004568700 [Elysia marginata]
MVVVVGYQQNYHLGSHYQLHDTHISPSGVLATTSQGSNASTQGARVTQLSPHPHTMLDMQGLQSAYPGSAVGGMGSIPNIMGGTPGLGLMPSFYGDQNYYRHSR